MQAAGPVPPLIKMYQLAKKLSLGEFSTRSNVPAQVRAPRAARPKQTTTLADPRIVAVSLAQGVYET